MNLIKAITFLLCSTLLVGQTTPIRNPQIQGASGSIVSGATLTNSGTFTNSGTLGGAGTFNLGSGTVTLPATVSGLGSWAGVNSITTLGTITTGTWNATPIGVSYGGSGQTSLAASIQAYLDAISTTQGTVLYNNGTDWVALAPGTSGHYLKTQGAGANPVWAASTGTGSVTSVAVSGSDGIDIDSGSPITTSGTIALGINASTLKTHLSLNNVENTALSTWTGGTSIVTVGTIGTGAWQGTAIADAYISSAATWNAKQAGDATLTALAGTGTANTFPYFTSTDTAASASITAAGLALLDDANATAQRATLGLGTLATQNGTIADYLTTATAASTYQPLDAELTTLSSATAAGLALMDDANASAQRTTLGLGTLATQSATISDYSTTAQIAAAYQPLDADLTTLSSATAAGLALMDDADSSAQRTTLGLGALAVLGEVASAQITNGAIVNDDINAAAAIALSKLATDPLARANHTGTQAWSTITGSPFTMTSGADDPMGGLGGVHGYVFMVGGDGFNAGNGGTGGTIYLNGVASPDGVTAGGSGGNVQANGNGIYSGGTLDMTADADNNGGNITTTAGGSITTGTGNINTGNTSGTLGSAAFVAASDTAYDATSWNANTDVPTKNAIRDKLETMTGTGSVTSVAMTVPTFLSISGSPVTTSGTLAVTLSGTALPVANGGTGATALTDLITLATHTSGNYVATIADSGASEVTVANSGSENAGVTLALAAGITRDAEWDTLAEVETAMGAINILAATEIDTSAELIAILGDESGTGNVLTTNGAGGSLTGIPTSIAGTANEITASAATGAVTLSLPATIDLGGKTSFEIPNSATPTVDATGEVALDTTITDFKAAPVFFDGTDERVVVSMKKTALTATDNYVIDYDAATDEFVMSAASGGGAGLTNITETLRTASPNNTVNVEELAVSGGSTNTDLLLKPMGTGAFIVFNLPDGTATGGNKRGSYAIDFQPAFRNSAADVASGAHSVIIAGRYNKASGDYSFAGGYFNTVTGYAAYGYGYQQTASGYYTGALSGYQNTASGTASVVPGGQLSTASGDYSSAIGYYANATRHGQRAAASGVFAALGDAQAVDVTLRCKTTTNSAVEMGLDGSTTYLTIPSGKVVSLTVQVTGVKSDGSAVAHYIRQYSAKNVGGTSSEVYAEVTIGTDNAAGTSLDISTVDAGDYISIKPTGISAEVWRWVARVEAVEAAYGN